ncbi:unnamed protein product [Tuber aestivum]|uniref:Uncharacterized protein n=1 Tax=Tuber aestivum TaxID=59557 RepID=A0A292Q2J3_9PEZI|nr:unnamed protein product [Tuber aestivum]
MDQPASHRRVFGSRTPPSPPPTHQAHFPYLRPYSSVHLSTPSHIPRSHSGEFVQLSRLAGTPPGGYEPVVRALGPPLCDSPTTESPALASAPIASRYGVGPLRAVSTVSLESSGAPNALPIGPDQQQLESPVSEQVTQQTLHLDPVEFCLGHPTANYGGTGSPERGTSEYINVNLPDLEHKFAKNLPGHCPESDMDETCSDYSQCSGEFDFTAAFSLGPMMGGAHVKGGTGLEIPIPPVSNPLQEVELQNSTPPTPPVPLGRAGFSSRPLATDPTARHCRGCIPCAPHSAPSKPVTGSTGREGHGNLSPAPNDQSAGLPPTDPLPALINRERAALQDIPSSPTVVASLSITVGSVEGDVQTPYHIPSSAEPLRPDLEDRIPCRLLRRRPSGYFIPAVGADNEIVLRTDLCCDGTNDLPYSKADPHSKSVREPQSRSSGDKSPVHSDRTTSNVGQVQLFPKQHLTFVDPPSLRDQIHTNACGLDRREPRGGSPSITPLHTPPSSNGMEGSGNSGRKKSSLAIEVLGRDHPSPTNRGSTGSSFKSSPLIGAQGGWVFHHTLEREGGRHFSGVNGSYGLVDLGAVNVTSVTIEADNTRH